MTLLFRATIVLAACCLPGIVWGQTPPPSHHDKLKELDKWVGTWDVKGENFDGSPYIARHTWKWSLNKNYLMGTFVREVDGKERTVARTMIGWDVAGQQIRGWEFWDDSQGEFVVGDGGKVYGGGVFHDGDKYTFKGQLDWQGDDVQNYVAIIKKGDAEPGEWKITLTRAKAAAKRTGKIPPEALAALKYRVGEWKSTGWIDGVKQPSPGHEITTWNEQKCCIRVTNSFEENGVLVRGSGLIGWDPGTKQLVEHWYASDGSVATFCYALDKKNAWVGTCKWVYADGQTWKGESVLELKGDDKWEWTATCTEAGSGKKTTWKSVNRRVK